MQPQVNWTQPLSDRPFPRRQHEQSTHGHVIHLDPWMPHALGRAERSTHKNYNLPCLRNGMQQSSIIQA